MEKELQDVINAQKEQIEKLDRNVRDLEAKVAANEKVQEYLGNSLSDIRKTSNKTFWIVVIILVAVIILLGS